MPEHKHVESPEVIESRERNEEIKRRESQRQQERNREYDVNYQKRIAREREAGKSAPKAEEAPARKPFAKEEQRRKEFDKKRGVVEEANIPESEKEVKKKVVEIEKKQPESAPVGGTPDFQLQIFGIENRLVALEDDRDVGGEIVAKWPEWIPADKVLPDGGDVCRLAMWDPVESEWVAFEVPSTGDYVLTAQSGVLSWVTLQEFVCT